MTSFLTGLSAFPITPSDAGGIVDTAALRRLLAPLVTAKVAFVPGKAFFADGSGANTLRVSFSCADEAMIKEGISRLGHLIGQEAAAIAA